jgi:hypothetical protein
MKTISTDKHTSLFIDWVKELLTEEEGQNIARQGLNYLEILYKECTGKEAKKFNNKEL